VCTCIHTDTHTWEYAWECIGHVCACKFVQKCTCAYIYICVHVYLCACIFIYACMYVCAYAPCPPFHTHVSLSLTHSVDRVRPLSLLYLSSPISPRTTPCLASHTRIRTQRRTQATRAYTQIHTYTLSSWRIDHISYAYTHPLNVLHVHRVGRGRQGKWGVKTATWRRKGDGPCSQKRCIATYRSGMCVCLRACACVCVSMRECVCV